jgi:hypothetical protein
MGSAFLRYGIGKKIKQRELHLQQLRVELSLKEDLPRCLPVCHVIDLKIVQF